MSVGSIPIKVQTFKGTINQSSARSLELFINYSRHYSDLQKGTWQILIRDITYNSSVKDKGAKSSTYFTISSNFVRSINENHESVKTDLIIFEYKNYGSRLFYNPQCFWVYVTDTYQTATIKFEPILGEKNFEPFDVYVTVLFQRIV